MKVLKGKKKKVIEGREKPIWVDVGYTVFVGEYNGQETYSLLDERTGEKFSLFDINRDRQQPATQPVNDWPDSSGPIPTEDDVPF